MTLKELLDKYTYDDIAQYVEIAVDNNEHDLRDRNVKINEIREGFEEMKTYRPTFGYVDVVTEVRYANNRLLVSNTHLGTISDQLSHKVIVADNVTCPEQEILAAYVYQLIAHKACWIRYRDDDDFDDIDDIDNVQTARLLR